MTGPRNAVTLLLRPVVGFVEVITDPVELVSEAVEGALGVSKKQLKEILLVKDGLIVLDGGANLLLKDPDDFFCRLLLEVRELAQSGSRKSFSK